MNKPPAFQFYADDFLAGVADMTQAEVGSYILLLCNQWSRGEIPTDKARMALIAKGEVSEHVLAKFPDGKNKRMEAERVKQDEYRESRSQNGRLGGRPPKPYANHMVSQTKAYTKAQESSPSPSPSPSPLVERERGAEFPEVPPMSRKDFDAIADMRGVPKDCAEWFWNTNDARNWVDNHGQPIRKVEPLLLNALKSWRANESRAKTSDAATGKPAATVFNLTKIIEAKTEKANGLKARWAVETGLGVDWSSKEAQEEHRKLRVEIKELKTKIAGMA